MADPAFDTQVKGRSCFVSSLCPKRVCMLKIANAPKTTNLIVLSRFLAVEARLATTAGFSLPEAWCY